MSLHPFDTGQTRRGGANDIIGLFVNMLIGADLEELVHIQAAAVVTGLLGGQDMVGAGALVAVRHRNREP